MKESTAQRIDETITAWEIYSSGDYDSLRSQFQDSRNEEVRDIVLLAALEQVRGRSDVILVNRSLFSPLVEAVARYNKRDFSKSAALFAEWLTGKDYFSPAILNRFVDAAERSERYELILKVCNVLGKRRKYDAIVARPLFLAYFSLGKFADSLRVYRDHHSRIVDSADLQRVGMAFMQVGKYNEAEKILLALYERETGEKYSVNFDAVQSRYSPILHQAKELEKCNNRSYEESWQLGMAYLLHSRYSDAIRILQPLIG